METKRLIDRDVSIDHASIDLESGTKSIIVDEHGASRDPISRAGEAKAVLSKVWNGFVGDEGCLKSKEVPINGEAVVEKEGLVQKPEAEKPKKKRPKKPPKPPRPPKPLALDSADEKLIREMSELATMKRARIERMKELKRMKNAKSASSVPSTNLGALVITILFCLVIIWQGVFSRNSSSLSFRGSPESSVNGGLISVQFYNNVSMISPGGSTSASTDDVTALSRLSVHGEESRVPG
ncbi:hypothetical protein ACMD2_09931 [Ananas comosus]|uniref:Transmembrane protein n=1 Tax=Ananas comosus TaxID=4615 RepID=A0A199V1T9_ANACO|nr:hypothetical protein ACMD2_09931 [Ananas comosus]